MPLSDHEQRMLDQIESALYAEDPKFASSVRGGGLRAPTARRRLQGAGLFLLGLAMLVSGVAFAITGPRLGRRGDRPGPSTGARQRRGKSAGGSFTSRMEDRFRRRFEE